MYVQFPAMRGRMGSREYYACLMPLNAIPQMFKFTDWIGFSPEDREQRVLNVKRVPDLKHYILDNETDYLFASITASYKCPPAFTPIPGDDSIGTLKVKLGDEFVINDGQHRCAGICAALKETPNIGDHTISVLLFPWETKDRMQQMFSDLNRFVVKTSKSLDILYDKRDKLSAATLAALDHVDAFKDLVEKDDASLKSRSPKLFTLAALYDANRELLREHINAPISENMDRIVRFWNVVARNMPDWAKVRAGMKLAVELRAEKIVSHSTVLRALGGLGAELAKEPGWEDRLQALQSIDWSKKNPEWDNICIVANSVVSNRQARAATKAFIKAKLGMSLTDGEQRAIERPSAAAA